MGCPNNPHCVCAQQIAKGYASGSAQLAIQLEFLAFGAAMVVCSLFMGCGSSPHVYTLSSLVPSQVVVAAGDFTLTLSESNFNFDNDSKVVFGGITLLPSYLLQTLFRMSAPFAITTKAGFIYAAVTGGAASRSLPSTIKNPAPTLIGLSRETALLNSASVNLEVTGTNFLPASTVKVGDKSPLPTSVNPTRLAVVVPDTSLAIAQTLPVTIVNPEPGGGTTNAADFTALNPVRDAVANESGAGAYITRVMPQRRSGEKYPCASWHLAADQLIWQARST